MRRAPLVNPAARKVFDVWRAESRDWRWSLAVPEGHASRSGG